MNVHNSNPSLIVGHGFTGAVLSRQLSEKGKAWLATKRSLQTKESCANYGSSFREYSFGDGYPFPSESSLRALFWLAPAPELGEAELRQGFEWVDELPKELTKLVIISTATYGNMQGVVDEHSDTLRENARHHRWGLWDDLWAELQERGHRVCRIRTPAIYGVGRDHYQKLKDGTRSVVDTKACTSRIHVEDLSSILINLVDVRVLPPVVLACDDEPTPTCEVVRYAAKIYGLPAPRTLLGEELNELSPRVQSMWLNDRRCVSTYRNESFYTLRYPHYRAGLHVSRDAYAKIIK